MVWYVRLGMDRRAPRAPRSERGPAAARTEPALSAVALLLVAAAFVTQLVRVGFQRHTLVGDHAALDLDVLDAHRALPLAGSYSQYGFRHPGPMFIEWMTLARGVVHSEAAYSLGMLTLNALLATVGLVCLGRVAGRRTAVGGAAVAALVISATGWSNLSSPWNPLIATVGIAAFILCGVGAWFGDRWSAVAAVAVGSLLVQSHVGNVGMCAVVLATLLIVAAMRDRAACIRVWWPAGVLGVALWAGPLFDLVANRSASNPVAIARFGRSGAVTRTGLRPALLAGLRSLRPMPGWLGGHVAPQGVRDWRWPSLLLIVVAAVLAGVLAARWGRTTGNGAVAALETPAMVGLALSTIAWASGVVMLGLGRGPVRAYYTFHLDAAAMTMVAFASWVIVGALSSRSAWARGFAAPASVPLVAVVSVVAGGMLLWSTLAAAPPADEPSPAVNDAVVAAVRSEAAGRTVVVSRGWATGTEPEFASSIGFLDRLARAGLMVRAAPDLGFDRRHRVSEGLRIAVPTHLAVERPRRGDLDVVIYAGEPNGEWAGWRLVGRLDSGLRLLSAPG